MLSNTNYYSIFYRRTGKNLVQYNHNHYDNVHIIHPFNTSILTNKNDNNFLNTCHVSFRCNFILL